VIRPDEKGQREDAMAKKSRRQFVGLLGASAAMASSPGEASAQAPSREKVAEGDEARKRLSAALRELNQEAALGVATEDFDRAEAYMTGALREAARLLRPLPLAEGTEPAVVFRARRRG